MPFQLLLFSTDEAYLPALEAGAFAAIVVDLESAEKHERQRGRDTQIAGDTHADLERVRAATRGRIICRINGPGADTTGEVEPAIQGGADELLLPMIRTAAEVEKVLELVNGHCDFGILVETEAAVAAAEQLAELPLARVYVGLNDLSIDRGSPSIFEPLVDGTLDDLRATFTCPFGSAG
jgi:citrate lyase beta subunit